MSKAGRHLDPEKLFAYRAVSKKYWESFTMSDHHFHTRESDKRGLRRSLANTINHARTIFDNRVSRQGRGK